MVVVVVPFPSLPPSLGGGGLPATALRPNHPGPARAGGRPRANRALTRWWQVAAGGHRHGRTRRRGAMSDPKTVETLQRYKGQAQGDRGASWQGTHHEPIAKYPSFYTGKGLERGTAAGDVGWNAGKGEHAAYMKSKQQDPAASTVAGSPPSLIGERRYNRRDGMALKGVDTEVSAAALGGAGAQTRSAGGEGCRSAAGVCRTLTAFPPRRSSTSS